MKRIPFYLAVSVGIVALLYYFSGPEPRYCDKPFEARADTVVMFSTRWCPYCKKARQLFVNNQVAYCEYDVGSSSENQEAFTELGGSGVPLILIGEEIFYGFSEVGLKKSLIRQGFLQIK